MIFSVLPLSLFVFKLVKFAAPVPHARRREPAPDGVRGDRRAQPFAHDRFGDAERPRAARPALLPHAEAGGAPRAGCRRLAAAREEAVPDVRAVVRRVRGQPDPVRRRRRARPGRQPGPHGLGRGAAGPVDPVRGGSVRLARQLRCTCAATGSAKRVAQNRMLRPRKASPWKKVLPEVRTRQLRSPLPTQKISVSESTSVR